MPHSNGQSDADPMRTKASGRVRCVSQTKDTRGVNAQTLSPALLHATGANWRADHAIWGGLRGGISVAMALSLPNSDSRSLVLTLT